jgi:hypothetical protein
MAVLCEGLAVSRRGFYAYAQRQAAPWRDHDAVALLAPTRAIIHRRGRVMDVGAWPSRSRLMPWRGDGTKRDV